MGKISVTSSLRIAMQLPWMATLLAGIFWGCGYFCLPAPPMESSGCMRLQQDIRGNQRLLYFLKGQC